MLTYVITFSNIQLVPAVTELVVAELMYLQWMDPKEPIYIYINSTGTTRDDGETVSISKISIYEWWVFVLSNCPPLFTLHPCLMYWNAYQLGWNGDRGICYLWCYDAVKKWGELVFCFWGYFSKVIRICGSVIAMGLELHIIWSEVAVVGKYRWLCKVPVPVCCYCFCRLMAFVSCPRWSNQFSILLKNEIWHQNLYLLA